MRCRSGSRSTWGPTASVKYTLTALQTNAAAVNVKRSTGIRPAGGGAPVDLRCDRSETATSSAALGNPSDTKGSGSTLSCSNSAQQH